MERLFFLICICFANSYSGYAQSAEMVFVGSTPADPEIRSRLSISEDKKIDFIRWDLRLQNPKIGLANAFVLNIIFGEGQPNTLGFIGGGEKLSFTGEYTVSKSKTNNINGAVYQLKSAQLHGGIALVRLNTNLLHLLTKENKLMVGNGGWSYTLSRKEPLKSPSPLPNFTSIKTDSSAQAIFEGRTPCQIFAQDHNLDISSGCFKLKWKLTLNRDPQTFLPTTYQLRATFNRGAGIEGKWEIIKDVHSNALIYELHPGNQQKSFSLLAGDENVLFFIDQNKNLYNGNADFSFALNRRKKL